LIIHQGKYKVISNQEILDFPESSYFLMRIVAPEIAKSCKPGQFIMVNCGDDLLLRRPLSIHNITESGEIHILYSVLKKNSGHSSKGTGTKWLSGLINGAELDVLGPCGNGFHLDEKMQTLLLLGGGIGIAPLILLAKYAVHKKKTVILLIGARTKTALYPSELVPTDIEVVYVTDDGSYGEKAKLTDIVHEFLLRSDEIFSCGPQVMYRELQNVVPADIPVQVSLEVRMGCGTGACYACSIPTTKGMKRVCKEGPIFYIKDIIWEGVKL
jgi:dihydroorotate dehydrogenase electron transfer subunit